MQNFNVCLFVFVLLAAVKVSGNIELDVTGDTRRVIDLGVFGFGSHGEFQLRISHLFIADPDLFVDANGTLHHNEPLGFVLDQVTSEQGARIERNNAREEAAQRQCFITDPLFLPSNNASRHIFPLEGKAIKDIIDVSFSATITTPGIYALFFYNCKGFADAANKPLKTVAVSFTIHAIQYNVLPDGTRNYLSIGDQPLTNVYFIMSGVFSVVSLLWIRTMRRNRSYVHTIHYVMLFLVLVKTLSLFFDAVKHMHYSKTGETSAWDIFYYVILTAKGMTLFAVLLLLGAGWSILKPFLSEQDKKILLIVLCCQVFINVSIAVIEETSEGNKNWGTWLDVLRVLDVLCCCCVLLPIVWSIKNLRDAVGQEGKIAQSVSQMRLFRTFYIIVVAYIYFTRIVVVMIEGAMPYDSWWVPKLIREIASVSFYTYAGWKFRPAKDSAYAHLTQEDIEELEQRNEMDDNRRSDADVLP